MLVALILALMPAQAVIPDERDEVVVVARRRRCDVSIAGHVINSAEFRARAAEWRAGSPVRVVVPREARVSCLAKIMFRLADHGVNRAEFVDPAP